MLDNNVEAWHWDLGIYETVGVEPASFNTDQIAEMDLSGAVDDYVQTGTGAVRTRVGWRKTGLTINFPWEVRIDRVNWQAIY